MFACVYVCFNLFTKINKICFYFVFTDSYFESWIINLKTSITSGKLIYIQLLFAYDFSKHKSNNNIQNYKYKIIIIV